MKKFIEKFQQNFSFSDFFKSSLSVVLPFLLQILFTIFVAHVINKEVYGQYALILSSIYLVSNMFLAAPMAAFSRFYNAPGNLDRYINEFRFFNYLCIFASIIISSILLVVRNDFSLLNFTMLSMGILLIFSNSLKKSEIFIRMNRWWTLTSVLLEKFSKFGLPILAYLIWDHPNFLFFGYLFGYIISNIILNQYFKYPKFSINLSFRRIYLYWKFAYPLGLIAMCSWTVSFSDRFFIEYFWDLREVGIYASVSQFAGVASILGGLFTFYVNPNAYRLFSKNRKNAVHFYHVNLIAFMTVLLFSYIIYLALPNNFVFFIIGRELAQYPGIKVALNILVLSVMIGTFITATSLHFSLNKALKTLLLCWGLGASANLVANAVLVPSIGIIGASWATLAGNSICLALMYIAIFWRRFVNEKA